MRTIPCDKICIAPERQRREFKEADLQSLVASIQANQLFHAVTLREEGDRMVLVAGERRLRAIQDIYALGGSIRYDGVTVPEGEVPYATLGELGELEREEAELEENIRRVDLTWQERAAATARLANLRARQAEAAGLPPPSMPQLAEELTGKDVGSPVAVMRRHILLANHLDKPEVKAAKSSKEAFKILQRIEQTEKNKELAAAVGVSFSSDRHRAENVDSREWMAGCEAGTFDVILTDPPYGMGADEFGDSGGKAAGAHTYSDDADVLFSILEWFPAEAFRVTKAEAHLYMFCDIEHFLRIREAFAGAGWTCFRTPFIWHKSTANRAPWPENGPQRRWEMCFYAMKGKRQVRHLAGDVLTYASDPNLGHMAQKPVGLYRDLLERSVRPGDWVLDPFAGSGTIFPAANALHCYATGLEKDPAHYGICLKRLEALRAQGELPL